ncbi:MAG: AsnC family transcriptional regulator [Phycisphaerae bacterium]|nr:AsnC family transcriptional regulator [Phycisphaerae bacterium]
MTNEPLSAADRVLLDTVQEAVPLVEAPFAALAESLGMSESDVLARLRSLKHDRGFIRQIGAIFDTKALGYESTLVAARYDDDAIDSGAAVVSAHPGVSHNYRRNHAFNLWYTLAVPPDSRLGLERTAERLHTLSGAVATRLLPTLKLFKIGVHFDMCGHSGPTVQGVRPSHAASDQDGMHTHCLSEQDVAAIRVLQRDLALVSEPFAALAAEAGCTTAELLVTARRLLERKQMRRFAAVLRHREAGFAHNCMAVWNVPDADVEAAGATMAGFDAVSHCYLRPRHPDWPYNLFTMVHGRTEQEVRGALDAIAEATGIAEREELASVCEYKKTRIEYFTPAIAEWEARYG